MAKSGDNEVQKQSSVDKKKMATAAKKFKGVRMRTWGSWVSEIRAPNQKTRIWLGSYSTAEAAARAYDAALLCLKGSTSAAPNLNFPISSYQTFTTTTTLPMSPKSIQRVAAAAAANHQPIHPAAPLPPPPPPPENNNYTHFVPSPFSYSSSSYPATSSFSSSSPSPVSSPASDQLYDDVSLPHLQPINIYDYQCNNYEPPEPAHHVISPPASISASTWHGFDQFDQQHYQLHHDHDQEQFFPFDDSLISMINSAPPPAAVPMFDDFYYEGDIRLWSFAE